MSDVQQGQTGDAAAGAAAASAAATVAAGNAGQASAPPAAAPAVAPAQSAPPPATGAQATAAGGGAEPQQPQQYWPGDWREKIAEHIAAGNKDIMEKELRRLQTMDSPLSVYGSFRNMENTWATKRFVRLPGDDAKPEEIAEYHKAMGVPEKPEDYFKSVKLENDMVIGDADKPIADSFAAAVHKAGAPPQVVNAAMNWYFTQQQQKMDALAEQDDTYRRESTRALTDEWGGLQEFKARTRAISTLFAEAPGGPDVKNPNAVISRLLGGRTADGRVIGDDPDITKWLAALALEKNPMMTSIESGNTSGVGLEQEISAIEKDMRENRLAYFKDEKKQARYRLLLEQRNRLRA